MEDYKRKRRSSRHHFQSGRRKPKYTEFARAGQDILNKYGSFGENPDSVIAKKGMEYLDDIERDTHLSSALATRRAKLIQKGWRIVPASEKPKDIAIAEFMKRQLIDMIGSFEKDLEGMLDAIGKGFSLTEINYTDVIYRGKMLTGLKNLRYKEPKLFSFKFDKLGYYRINQIDPDPNGTELPSDKFIHIIMGPNDENPYGRSVDAECAFWVWVKKNVAKFWAIFAEKFGMPLSTIIIPNNVKKGSQEYNAAKNILDAVQEETGILVPDGFELKFLEAVRSGEAGYERFIEICNKEISKRVFGATLIAEEGKRGQGSYALGQEHSEIFEEYVTFDAAVLEAAISEQLIKRLVSFNWDVDVYPRFEFIEFAVGIFISFSQSIHNLVQSGLDIPKSWVYEKLKIPVPKEGDEVLDIRQPAALPSSAGPDNKIKMSDEHSPDSPAANRSPFEGGLEKTLKDMFKEAPEIKEIFKNIDKLSERYQNIMASEYEKLGELLKKKSTEISKIF